MKIARLLRDGALFASTASLPAATAAVASAGLRPLSRMKTAGAARLLLFALVVAVAFSPAFVPTAQAAPGDLDALNLNVSGTPTAVAVQPDGKFIIGGLGFTVGGVNRGGIARINADGSLDTAFNPNANSAVGAVAVQPDGRIIIAGYFTTLQPNGAGTATVRNGIARVNADGTLDTTFDPNLNGYVFGLAMQADGKVLIGGDFTSLQPNGGVAFLRNRIARLNADGTLDTVFAPNYGQVLSMALQADGKVLFGGSFTTGGRIARVDATGTVDTTFTPNANSTVRGLAIQADGRVLLVGSFTSVHSTARRGFARVLNDAATQTLAMPDRTQATWTRAGSAPEVTRVTFELSMDSGATWSALGVGTRVGTTANWQLTGLSLSGIGQVRARGVTSGGVNNAATGLMESVAGFAYPADILVTGNAVNIVNGDTTPAAADFTDFGNVNITAATLARTFTITNSGTATGDLTLAAGAITLSGANAADFTLGGITLPVTLAPGGSTTFSVTFDPSAVGQRNATVSIASNDPAKNPFTFSIRGTGFISSNADLAGLALSTGAFAPDFAAATTAYTASVLYVTATVTVTPVRAEPNASIEVRVNGGSYAAVASGSASGALALNVGANPVEVRVTAQDGITRQTYTVTVTRAASSSNADLASLTLSAGAFTPAFDAATTSYAASASVPYSTGRITVTPTMADTYASIQVRVNGGSFTAVTSGSASDRFALLLNVGANTVEIRLTAQDGTLKTYSLTITRGAPGAAGDLDSLDAEIPTGGVYSEAVQPDGKLIFAGFFGFVQGVARSMCRLNVDGSLDLSYDPRPSNTVWAMAMQRSGKMVIAGQFFFLQPNGAPSPTNSSELARLNADGSLASGFHFIPDNNIYCLQVLADDRVMVGGAFRTLIGSQSSNLYIARLDAEGTTQQTLLGFETNGPVRGMALQADGKVVFAGDFTAIAIKNSTSFLRNAIGRTDGGNLFEQAFDPNLTGGYVRSVAVQADGKILIGGLFTAVGGAARNNFARVNPDGTLDTGFNPDVNGFVYSLALQADGKIVLGGLFTAVGGIARNNIARVNADGTLDTAFDPNANAIVRGVSLQADGKVLVGGEFSTLQPNGALSPTSRPVFVRLLNDPATQTLSVPDASQVSWTRGGSAPLVSQVRFELSIDGGATWTPLGNATQVGTTPNWQLTGLTLPVTGRVRARGNVAGGWQNSSTGTIESVTSFTILTPQEIWRQTYFGSPANTGNGADLFDFDRDGYVNLLEFAFGLNPTQNSAGQLPQLDTSGGNFTYSFTQPNGITGITYGAEWSITLLPGSLTPIPETGTFPQHIFSVPIGSDTKKFIRLKITSP